MSGAPWEPRETEFKNNPAFGSVDALAICERLEAILTELRALRHDALVRENFELKRRLGISTPED